MEYTYLIRNMQHPFQRFLNTELISDPLPSRVGYWVYGFMGLWVYGLHPVFSSDFRTDFREIEYFVEKIISGVCIGPGVLRVV